MVLIKFQILLKKKSMGKETKKIDTNKKSKSSQYGDKCN